MLCFEDPVLVAGRRGRLGVEHVVGETDLPAHSSIGRSAEQLCAGAAGARGSGGGRGAGGV